MRGARSAEGRSPAIEKQREKRRLLEAKSFGEFGEKWLIAAPMADSTRAMRRSIFERELLPVWRSRLLTEIAPDDLRAHCAAIVERGAPATAIHVRDIVKQIYGFAILHGEKIANPADEVGPASIATFVPRDRSLSPTEIRIMLKQLEHVATLPTIRLGYAFVSAHDGPQERTAGRHLGRGRFRERGLDDSQGADEALEGAQRLSVPPGRSTSSLR